MREKILNYIEKNSRVDLAELSVLLGMEQNVCRNYNTSWACPPAVGSLKECRRKMLRYDSAMVFNAVYKLSGSFDLDGMRNGHREFKKVCDRLYAAAKDEYADFLILSNEGCVRCEKCTYPDEKCRMPDILFPSLEGFGINVSELAALAGVNYINGKDTVTYFGMLLYK